MGITLRLKPFLFDDLVQGEERKNKWEVKMGFLLFAFISSEISE
jgi:hypothetical protein